MAMTVAGNVLTFDFTQENWRTAMPDYYSVTDSATPFYTAGTFQYNGVNTLRSGGIGHSATSSVQIDFTLVSSGSLELNYAVSSEANYDKLIVTVDGTAVLTKSGTVSWTDYSQELSAGDHTLLIQYSKDGSASSGSDACAIGKLILTGVKPPYDRKYLIRSGSTLYTITDGALSVLTETEVTASLFQTYGVDELPDGSLLLSLTDPEVLYWHDSTDELPALTIRVTGSPPVPQTVITGPQDMSDPTILGIESASVDASDDVLFALSFDDGATWKAYSGTGWVTLETENAGMTKATMENIGLEAWAEVVTSDSYRVRFTLVSADSYVAGVVIHYINEESEEESNA